MSWCTQDSRGRNPDRRTGSIFLVSIKLKIELNISFSNNFLQIVNKNTGRYFFINCLSPFLWTGTILLLFQTSGKCRDARQFLKSKVSGLHTEGTHSLSIFAKISSCPWALFGSRFLVSWKMASEEILKELTTHYNWIVADWLAKYSLNMLALASNPVISLLFTSRRDILGTFFPFHKVLSAAQYDFMNLEESPSFFPRRIK